MAHGGLLVLLTFLALLCAAGAGMYLHDRLGERHRTSETMDHVRLVVSILVTFTALVLSLLLSEVKGNFDTFDARLRSFAGDLSKSRHPSAGIWPGRRADPRDAAKIRGRGDRRQLARRARRRQAIIRDLRMRWASSARNSALFSFRSTLRFTSWTRPTTSASASRTRSPTRSTRRCAPGASCWRRRRTRSRGLSCWRCAPGSAVVFGVFGLLSPRNAVVYLSIMTCAICVASAVFLIDDFDSPLDGLMRAPSDSMRATLAESTRPEQRPAIFCAAAGINRAALESPL